MRRQEPAGSLDDLLRRGQAPVVHVPGRELLAVAGGARRLRDVHQVAKAGPPLLRIAGAERPVDGAGAAIVVHDHRVCLRRIEVGREDDVAVDGPARRHLEGPVLHAAGPDAGQLLLCRAYEGSGGGLLEVQGDKGLRLPRRRARDCAGERPVGQDKALGHVHRQGDGREAWQLLVVAVQPHPGAVLGAQVDAAVDAAPGGAIHRRVELAGDGRDGIGGRIPDVELAVALVGDDPGRHVHPRGAEGGRSGMHQQAPSVRGVARCAQPAEIPQLAGGGRGQLQLPQLDP